MVCGSIDDYKWSNFQRTAISILLLRVDSHCRSLLWYPARSEPMWVNSLTLSTFYVQNGYYILILLWNHALYSLSQGCPCHLAVAIRYSEQERGVHSHAFKSSWVAEQDASVGINMWLMAFRWKALHFTRLKARNCLHWFH